MSICIKGVIRLDPMKEKILLGTWSEEKLDGFIAEAAKIKDIGERIALLSGQFIGMPYKESTLIGDTTTPETLVINIEAFDCFTLLDCVEAMRLSRSFVDFHENLIRIRYKEGIVEVREAQPFFHGLVATQYRDCSGSDKRNRQQENQRLSRRI